MGRSIIRKDIVRSIFREIKIEAKSEQEKMALLEMVNIQVSYTSFFNTKAKLSENDLRKKIEGVKEMVLAEGKKIKNRLKKHDCEHN